MKGQAEIIDVRCQVPVKEVNHGFILEFEGFFRECDDLDDSAVHEGVANNFPFLVMECGSHG